MRGCHDVGGMDLGPVQRSEHDYALWEKRVDAMMVLLWQKKGLLTLDEHRHAMETLDADEYRTITYYERWMAGIAKALLARGIITTDELGRHMAAAGDKR